MKSNKAIILHQSLIDDINKIEINIIQRNIKINLMNFLPNIINGYTISNSLYHINEICKLLNNIDYKLSERVNEYDETYDNRFFCELSLNETILIDNLAKYLHLFYGIKGFMTLKDFILKIEFIMAERSNPGLWTDTLSINDDLKLYIAIIKSDIKLINEYLIDIDPRCDHYEAYHLAIETKNDDIIKIIKDDIIKSIWFEIQVLKLGLQDNYSDDIIKYYLMLNKY